MEMRRTERLFERYRAKGDLRALGEVFDRTAPELLALAMHLVAELADAEDVLQATFVTAIERADAWDRRRRLVPWLVGILVNHAKSAHRRASRRRVELDGAGAVDGAVAGADGDPSQRVAAGEVEALVADALRSLPARDREVLERHLVGEERAVDIARALGRAPGTVRMQIHRGLERLRRALPPGTVAGLVPALAHVSPDVSSGGAVARGGAAVREAVLAHARVHVPAGAGAAGSVGAGPAALSVLTAGGAIVSTKLVLSVVGALGAGVLGWVLLGPRSDVGALAPRVAARAAEAGAALERRGGERPDAPASEAVRVVEDARAALAAPAAASAEPPGPPPGWYVVGRVAGLRDGDDPTDVTINVHSFAARAHPFVGARARPDGTFAVDVTPIVEDAGVAAQELLCSANHPLHVSGNAIVEPSTAELRRAGERTEWSVELPLVRASGVVGRVATADGGALHDVDLRLVPLEPDGAPAGDAREVGCEEDGSFDLRFTEHGSFALVAHADGFLPTGRRVAIPVETIVDVGTLELARGDVAIEGRVALPAGRTVRCSVHAVRDGSPPGQRAGPVYVRRATWDGERAAPRMQRAEVDARGGFRLAGLVPGGWRLWADGFEGVLRVEAPPPDAGSDLVLAEEALFDARTGATAQPADPGALRADAPRSGVVLTVGAAWLDVVVTADGTPLDGARVEVGHGDGGALASGAADGGRLALLFDAPGAYVVAAEAPGFERTSSRVTVVEGEAALVLELVRSATGALEIVADAALREELVMVKVLLARDGLDGPREEQVALADGVARIDGLAAGRWAVAVEPGSSSFGQHYDSYILPARHDVEIEPGGVVRLAYAPSLGGRARIVVEGLDEGVEWVTSRFLGPDGLAVDVMTVTRTYGGNVISVGASKGAVAAHAESTTYPNLAPGLHQLVLEHEGWDVPPVAFTVVAGETVDVRVRAQRR